MTLADNFADMVSARERRPWGSSSSEGRKDHSREAAVRRPIQNKGILLASVHLHSESSTRKAGNSPASILRAAASVRRWPPRATRTKQCPAARGAVHKGYYAGY